MSERNDGGPAFPIQNANYTAAYGGAPGMSLRQWYAGQAIPALIQVSTGWRCGISYPDIAVACFVLADAMLAAEAAASVVAPTFTDADLFNCWVGGKGPSLEEVARFDCLEVGGVRDANADEDWTPEERERRGTHMEACDDADAEFWSVYGRYRPSDTHAGCECITDGPPGDKERAWAIAEHLGRLWGLEVKER